MTTKREMVSDIGLEEIAAAHLVDNNTMKWTDHDGVIRYRLHHTDVVEIRPNGDTLLYTGGWYTPTTKDRINKFQNMVSIHQDKSVWYATDIRTGNEIEFYDGMNVAVMKARPAVMKAKARTLKQIDVYIKKLRTLDTLPEPTGGDCWLCMFPESGTDHLISHLKEKYIHGTLIFNALRDAGYRPAGIPFIWGMFNRGDQGNVVRAVRRYFKSKLGIPI